MSCYSHVCEFPCIICGLLVMTLNLQDMAETRRKMVGVPDLDTVFSQARNGRLKRLEESLNLGMYLRAVTSCTCICIFSLLIFLQGFLSILRMQRETHSCWSLVRIATAVWLKCFVPEVLLSIIKTPKEIHHCTLRCHSTRKGFWLST